MIEPNAWVIGLNEIIRLLVAVFIGGLIGIERELHYKAAGFRTMMLICVGAALFTMFSIRIGGPSDPARIAAQIVTGVGFIGAGVILHEKGEVRGITTAASIWAAAALGIGIGAGYLLFAAIATALLLFVAAVLPWFERRIVRSVSRAYTITTHLDPDRRAHLQETFQRCGLQAHCDSESKRGDLMQTVWHVIGSAQGQEQAVAAFYADPAVLEFES
jgi:putative Mg2+ transporter-C (MgtC) family protein